MATSRERLILILTVGSIAGILLIPGNPVNSKLLKLAFLGCVLGAWLGLLLLAWRRRHLRFVVLSLPVLMALPFLLPGRGIDVAELRRDYVRRMVDLEGTRYFWGGESSRGIDCSGLPRRAFRDALLAYGLRHLNGRAVRGWLEQWWFDASAKALGEGYRGYTFPLGRIGTIHEMDDGGLLPGDLAVTCNGVHVIVYLGEGRWIQADPGIGMVKTLHGRKDSNGWFRQSVAVHRWNVPGVGEGL